MRKRENSSRSIVRPPVTNHNARTGKRAQSVTDLFLIVLS